MTTPARSLVAGLVLAWGLFALTEAFAQGPATQATTSYSYDEAGNRTGQVDALGRSSSWAYDAKHRLTGRTSPDGRSESFGYDPTGELLTHTTFAGEAFAFQYDAMSRLTGQVIPAGRGSNSGIAAASVSYGYTPVDMLRSRREQGATTLQGEQTFSYDAADRLLEASSPIGRIAYLPDAMGNVLERTLPDAGTVRYEYDAAGRMVRVITPDGRQTRYSYDGAGRLARIERELASRQGQPQSIRTSFNYDPAGRVTLIGNVRHIGAAASFVAGQRITRGPGGAITKIVTDRGDGSLSTTGQLTARIDVVQQFEFDGLARLIREVREHSGGVSDTRYGYDAVGNRQTKSVTTAGGTDTTTYTYDAADRLTQESIVTRTGASSSIEYGWDDNGNLASRSEPAGVTLYRFDPRNRLIDIRVGATRAQAQAATPQVRHAYDADGNRVRATSGEQVREFLVDVNHPLPQLARESTAAETIDYVRGLSQIRQVRKTATAEEQLYPLYGHLGSSLGAVNADGDVVEQVDVDAFGNLDQPTGAKQTHLYTGEYWDPGSQLLYLRARWYDPRVGRFVSADPFEGRPEDPRSLNRYVYTQGDPIHLTDPSGLVSLPEAMATLNNLGTAIRTALPNVNQVRQLGAKACHIGASIVLPYKELSGKLLAGSSYQAHHILQNALMAQHAQKLGIAYSRLGALAIPMFGGTHIPGSPHGAASAFQRNNPLSEPSFNQLMAHAYKALLAAGCRKSDATTIVDMAQNMYKLDKKGVLP
jgi:RHS repeat-associated protein